LLHIGGIAPQHARQRDIIVAIILDQPVKRGAWIIFCHSRTIEIGIFLDK
jgi:hypothetical protein